MSSDARLASSIAREAGRLLRSVRRAGLEGQELRKEGDRRSNELILARLARARPTTPCSPRNLPTAPLDWVPSGCGSLIRSTARADFGMEGRADWAVHVALWESGKGITAAAVAEPALDRVYANDDAVAADLVERMVLLVSDSRPPEFAGTVAEAIGRGGSMGSAGVKAMAVLRGEAATYMHAGGQWEWDSAAPVGVAIAAGLHASRIDGSPLIYNQANPYCRTCSSAEPTWLDPI